MTAATVRPRSGGGRGTVPAGATAPIPERRATPPAPRPRGRPPAGRRCRVDRASDRLTRRVGAGTIRSGTGAVPRDVRAALRLVVPGQGETEPPVAPGGGAEGALRVELLGRCRVTAGGRPVAEGAWRLRKAKTLLKLLALAPGHRLHREQAAATLWPDFDPAAAGNNLKQVLHAARRALEGPAGAAAGPGGGGAGATTSPGTSGGGGAGGTARAGAPAYLALQGDLLCLSPDGPLWVD